MMGLPYDVGSGVLRVFLQGMFGGFGEGGLGQESSKPKRESDTDGEGLGLRKYALHLGFIS